MLITPFLRQLLKTEEFRSGTLGFPLILKQGQLLNGKIINVYSNQQALIDFGEFQLTAHLSNPLETGKRAWFMVEKEGNPIVLKRIFQVPQEKVELSKAMNILLEEKPKTPHHQEFKSFVQTIMSKSVPFTSKQIEDVFRLSYELGKIKPYEDSVEKAIRNDLPLTKESILSLHEFSNDPLLEPKMKRFIHELKKLEVKIPEKEKKEEVKQIIKKLESEWEIFHPTPTKKNPLSTETSSSFLESKTEREEKSEIPSIGENLKRKETKEMSTPLPPLSTHEEREELTSDYEKSDLLHIFKKMGIFYERNIKVKKERDESVKGLVMEWVNKEETDIPPSLSKAGEKIIRHITGQQLSLYSPESSPFYHGVLQVPIGMEDGKTMPATIEIHSKKKEKGGIDAEHCQLYFHLDMPHLGVTAIHLMISNRIVNLSFYHEKEETLSLLKEESKELEGELELAGYRMGTVNTKYFSRGKEGKVNKLSPPSYQRIDIKL